MNHTLSKILVVVESIDENDSSASKGRVALIYNLSKLGYNLKVLHYTKKDIKLKSIDCVCIPELKFTVNYFLSRLQRVFTRVTGIKLHLFFENLFGFSFTFYNDANSIKKSLIKESDFNPDLVLTLSKGSSFRPHFALLNLPKFHGKWMAYVHDPYPFHFYPRPYNWVEPGYRKKEQFFREVSEKAAYSAFPSLLLKEWMGSYFENFLKTGVVIPHQNSKYEVQNRAFSGYFDHSKFNLLHAGNLMQHRSPEGLTKGFNLFLKQHPEARKDSRLLLLGPASYHNQLLESYQKISPEIYIHNGNVAFDVVYHLQQHVSVNIILESKSEISPFLPGKFPHCVAANKPILVLGPYYSETRRLLGNDYPYWAEVDDAENIAKKIEMLYGIWLENKENLKLNRDDLIQYLGSEHLKIVLENL
jgi:hypothetical protein